MYIIINQYGQGAIYKYTRDELVKAYNKIRDAKGYDHKDGYPTAQKLTMGELVDFVHGNPQYRVISALEAKKLLSRGMKGCL